MLFATRRGLLMPKAVGLPSVWTNRWVASLMCAKQNHTTTPLLTTSRPEHFSFQPTTTSTTAARRAPQLGKFLGSYRTMSSLPHRRYLADTKRRTLTPTREIAFAMPLSEKEMDNSSLITLAALDDHKACCEILIRHIMIQDNVSYESAKETFEEIKAFNHEGMFLRALPFQTGITVALVAGFASFPLCFHLESVAWFNEWFVTTDVPPERDLETWLEVGSWAWNWMEPPLGQISFFLLCVQFATAQMENLGLKPYTRRVKQWRADRVVAKYPQYDARLLSQFSKTSRLTGD